MRYLVTMESLETGLLPPQQNAQIIEQLIVPGLEAVVKLEKERKILAGGVFVGTRGGVVIMEAASHDELDRLLVSLPFWGIMKIEVTPLESFESRVELTRKMVEQLKAASR